MQYFVKISGEEKGPVTSRQLKALADKGHVKPTDHVRKADGKQWHLAQNVKGLFADSNSYAWPPEQLSYAPEPPVDSVEQSARPTQQKPLHVTTVHRTPMIITGCVVGVLVLGSILFWFLLRESPQRAYRHIIARAEAGEWEEVWNRIDKKSQAKMEMTLHMMAGMEAVFDKRKEELRLLTGKQLFLRIINNYEVIKSQYVNRTVDTVEVDGDHATLTVWVSKNGSKERSKGTVHMIHEDGVWKVNMEPPEDHATASASLVQVPQKDESVGQATPRQPSTDTMADPDFRNVKWGMTIEKVRGREDLELVHESPDTLGYKETVGGHDCIVLYIFVNDVLVRAKYLITERHTNDNEHVMDFESIGTLLAQKYGDPTTTNVVWKNDLYKDALSEYGMAVAMGHLSMYQKWSLPLTTVLHYLNGDNFEIEHGIEYIGKEYEHLEEGASKQEALDDL
ncbi:MAG: DUF4339 domain-containing protein [Pirellulaceae bacterium]